LISNSPLRKKSQAFQVRHIERTAFVNFLSLPASKRIVVTPAKSSLAKHVATQILTDVNRIDYSAT
jgi:hypothetical protein